MYESDFSDSGSDSEESHFKGVFLFRLQTYAALSQITGGALLDATIHRRDESNGHPPTVILSRDILSVIAQFACKDIAQACKLNGTDRSFARAAKKAIVKEVTVVHFTPQDPQDYGHGEGNITIVDRYPKFSSLRPRRGSGTCTQVIDFFTARPSLANLVSSLRLGVTPTMLPGRTTGYRHRPRLAFHPFPASHFSTILRLFPHIRVLTFIDSLAVNFPLTSPCTDLRAIRYYGCLINAGEVAKFLGAWPSLEQVYLAYANTFTPSGLNDFHSLPPAVWHTKYLSLSISPFMEEVPFRIAALSLHSLEFSVSTVQMFGISMLAFHDLVLSSPCLQTLGIRIGMLYLLFGCWL